MEETITQFILTAKDFITIYPIETTITAISIVAIAGLGIIAVNKFRNSKLTRDRINIIHLGPAGGVSQRILRGK